MKTLELKTVNLEQIAIDKANVVAMQSGTKQEAQEGFNQLYKRHKNSVIYNIIIKKFFLDEETAKDLTQEIFMKIFMKIQLYDFSTAFSTWLYRIAGNHIIDYKRKGKCETLNLDSLGITSDEGVELSFQIEDKSENVQNSLIKKQTAMMIREAVESIKSKEGQQIINLIFLEGLSYEETSKQMNMPLGTIKGEMHRAKGQMKNSISKYLVKENFDISIIYGKSFTLKEIKMRKSEKQN